MMDAQRAAVVRQGDERAYYDATLRLYRRVAWIYDVVTIPLRPLRRRVARSAGIAPGMRVLDVATGTGAQARAFTAAGARVVGLDLSRRMLAIARRRTHSAAVRYLEADATRIPAKDGSFDAACVSFALHEMPESIWGRAVAELVRVTRPGGTVVIVDFARPRPRVWRWLVEHAIALFEREYYGEFLRSDLPGLLRRNGVSIGRDHPAMFGAARILVGTRA